MTKPKRRYADAPERLHRTLAALTAQGERTPCAQQRGFLWLADDVEDRALAVKLCRPCPILQPCGRAAQELNEQFGVWGGKDRTWPKHAGQDSDAA